LVPSEAKPVTSGSPDREPAAVAGVASAFAALAGEAFAEHARLLEATRARCLGELERLAGACALALARGRTLLFFGNGGSAADAQHLATELIVRYAHDRRALAAVALTTDTSTLTAAGNDLGFEQVFARQIEALGRPGDVAIGISTSGNSANVVRALETARARGLIAAALTGHDGGRLAAIADPLVAVPARDTARIQEMHILLGHVLCASLEHGARTPPGS